VKRVEFSLDNSDARCTGYYKCRLRIWFWMIVYLGNRLFYFFNCCIQGWDATQVYNSCVTDVDAWVWTSRFDNLNVKTWPNLLWLMFWYSVFFQFSVGGCGLRFLEDFRTVFLWFCCGTVYYRYPHSDTLSFLIFWVLVSGPPSASFLTLAYTSSWTIGLQLNFTDIFHIRLP